MVTQLAKPVELLRPVSPLPYLANVLLSIEEMRVSAQGRLSHLQRHGREDIYTESVLNALVEYEGRLTKLLRKEMKEHAT